MFISHFTRPRSVVVVVIFTGVVTVNHDTVSIRSPPITLGDQMVP